MVSIYDMVKERSQEGGSKESSTTKGYMDQRPESKALKLGVSVDEEMRNSTSGWSHLVRATSS